MSLVDTAVVGAQSSIELAALGPATSLCDNLAYICGFLAQVACRCTAQLAFAICGLLIVALLVELALWEFRIQSKLNARKRSATPWLPVGGYAHFPLSFASLLAPFVLSESSSGLTSLLRSLPRKFFSPFISWLYFFLTVLTAPGFLSHARPMPPQKVTTNLAASALASGDSLMADRVSLALFCAKSSWVFCCPEGDEH